MTTGTDVARRTNGTVQQPAAALALRGGQTMWDDKQRAALVAMGIPKDAPSADLAIFLHQCQRTGLDPFIKQIYLIYRPVKEDDGKYTKKPTTQVGIDGYRLIRDRIAKREGLRVEYEDTIWYGSDGTPCDVWLWDEPPAACKVTVVVDGRRFPSVLRFSEYCQRKRDGNLNSMWSTKSAHMIEKCCEADALRRAFPQDMSGLMLEDTAPLPEDAPPAPQRVTSEQIRQRRQPAPAQVVEAEIVDDNPEPPAAEPSKGTRTSRRQASQSPSPAQPQAPAAAPAPQGAGEDTPGGGEQQAPQLASAGQVNMIGTQFERLGYTNDDEPSVLRAVARLAEVPGLESVAGHLTAGQAALVIRRLDKCTDPHQLGQMLEQLAAAAGGEAK